MRDSFIFYRSFATAARSLPVEQEAELLQAIITYALDGVEPTCQGAVKGMFSLIKPQIDANNRKYENGKKGGRPKKSEQKPKENQEKTKSKPNVNDNVNVNENDTVNVNDKMSQIKEKAKLASKDEVEKRLSQLRERRGKSE